MILAVHALTGAVLGSVTKNSVLAIIFSLFSHYLLDVIPHRDYVIPRIERQDFKGALKTDAIKVFFDLLVGGLLVIFVIKQKPDASLPIFCGAFSALIPDGLGLLYHIFDKVKPGWLISRLLEKHYFFHVVCLQKKRPPKITGWAVQILILITVLSIVWFS